MTFDSHIFMLTAPHQFFPSVYLNATQARDLCLIEWAVATLYIIVMHLARGVGVVLP